MAFILLTCLVLEDIYQPSDLEDQLDILGKVHAMH